MIKRALYLGIAVVSMWQLLRAVNCHLDACAKSVRREQKEAISAWENEGGSLAPQ